MGSHGRLGRGWVAMAAEAVDRSDSPPSGDDATRSVATRCSHGRGGRGGKLLRKGADRQS
jgi:hypothetical protein